MVKSTQYLGEARMRQVVRNKIEDERWKQSKLAEKFNCSTNFISLMLNGHRNLSEEILTFAGYEKITLYRRKGENIDE
jgi:transcriptional regulator with XRE-family HTH domain